MSTLKIAANLIEAISSYGLGHLQIVRERDDGYQEEIEVQAPFWLTLGNFTYPAVRDHTASSSTSNYGVDYEYNAVELDIGDRSADDVWDLLVSVHSQFQVSGQDIDYDFYQNSNSYATTLLNVIGINFLDYFTAVRPFNVSSFPGAGLNLLESEETAIDLNLTGGARNDVIRTGVGSDNLIGGNGKDDLQAGGGSDTLFGGIVQVGESSEAPSYIDDKVGDYLSGGAGEDNFVIVASDDNYNNSLPDPYWGNALTAREAAWYALSLNYIDTVRDQDNDGTISVSWTFQYQTYNVELGFDFYENFVAENFDTRSGFLYNDTSVSGNWQINTGPTTGVYLTQMRNHSGGFSNYVIVQGGYGALGVETHNPVFAIELDAINTQQRATLTSKVLEIGTSNDDIMVGASDDDQLFGEDGDDTITGDLGSDYIEGGNGEDNLQGGGGGDVLLGGDGDDVIYGDDGDDILYGNGGADQLYGGQGNDTLVVDADDTVINGGDGYDRLVFSGSENFIFSMTGTGIEDVRSGAGNDLLTGSDDSDSISDGAGNDVVNAGSGDDVLTIGTGNNQIDGGEGEDYAVFEGERSQYTFSLFNGNVISFDGEFTNIITGIEHFFFADGEFSLVDLLTNQIVGTTDDDVLFGTSGEDAIQGLAGDDFLNGSFGSDAYIYAMGDGNDTISDESIELESTDVLRFTDMNIEDLVFSRDGEDLLITVKSTGHVITVNTQYYNAAEGWALEKIEFADGTSLSLDHSPDTSWIYGTNSSETIDGNWGKDYFFAGQGNDIINGSAGSDVYVYAAGDGNDTINDDVGFYDALDVLRFTDVNASNITAARHGDDVELTVVSTGEVITLKGQLFEDPGYWGIDKVEFADGASWDRDALTQLGLNAVDKITVFGTVGDDTLYGTSGHDVFNGGVGNDFLLGGYGSDTYLYAAGDGTDYIDDEANAENQIDVLKFTDLNQADITAARDGVNLKLTVTSTGDTITLDEQYYADTDYWGFEKIEFADGSSWNRDAIMNIGSSSARADSVALVVANDDVLTASTADDTFVFADNFGHATIIDFVAGEGSGDAIDLPIDAFSDFAAVMAAATDVGNDALITQDANNSILLKNVALASLHQDDFRFHAAA